MPKSERDEWPWLSIDLPIDGAAHGRLHLPGGADAAVVMVGGVGGGFDTPGGDLSPRLAEDLAGAGMGALRVRFRDPRSLGDAVADVRAAIGRLGEEGVRRVGLVGHSFGGAVAIQSAVDEPAVRAVATLATQAYGTDRVGGLQRPLLLVHGDRDDVLPTHCSVDVAERAGEAAELHILPDSGHDLLEHRSELRRLLSTWLCDRLAA